MNTIVREKLVSIATTFITVFLVTLGAQIQLAGTVEFTFAFWASVLIAAGRAALQAVAAGFITLGKKLGAIK